MSGNDPWTETELEALRSMGPGAKTLQHWKSLEKVFHKRSGNALRIKYGELVKAKPIPQSVYPSYDSPLEWEGDALILPDPEFPFHNADWVNRCVSLAQAWGITHLVIAGDMVHMDSLSGWEPSWAADDAMDNEVANLPKELEQARRAIVPLIEAFSGVDLILGNHEGRMLRALDSVLSPGMLLRFLGVDRIRSAPYYHMTVLSNGVPYLIEHPRTTAIGAPGVLADKYQKHVLMAHSHKVGMTTSRSGEWQGWHIGCCVDEAKLAYASQRHNGGHPHKLGAAIVRQGALYTLFDGWTDFEWLKGRQNGE